MLRSILEDIKKLDCSQRKLREFGVLMGGVFLVIGAFAYWRGHRWPLWGAPLSACLILLGWITPQSLLNIYRIWMGLAMILGWVVSRVILTILFFLILTPTALLLKILGKDFMDRKQGGKEKSFWQIHAINKPKESYENQF